MGFATANDIARWPNLITFIYNRRTAKEKERERRREEHSRHNHITYIIPVMQIDIHKTQRLPIKNHTSQRIDNTHSATNKKKEKFGQIYFLIQISWEMEQSSSLSVIKSSRTVTNLPIQNDTNETKYDHFDARKSDSFACINTSIMFYCCSFIQNFIQFMCIFRLRNSIAIYTPDNNNKRKKNLWAPEILYFYTSVSFFCSFIRWFGWFVVVLLLIVS